MNASKFITTTAAAVISATTSAYAQGTPATKAGMANRTHAMAAGGMNDGDRNRTQFGTSKQAKLAQKRTKQARRDG